MDNLDPKHMECLREIAVMMAENKQSGWSGKVNIEINFTEGGIGSSFLGTRKKMLAARTRGVRSSGLK